MNNSGCGGAPHHRGDAVALKVEFSEGVQTSQVLHAADVIPRQVEKAQPAQVGHAGYPGDLERDHKGTPNSQSASGSRCWENTWNKTERERQMSNSIRFSIH